MQSLSILNQDQGLNVSDKYTQIKTQNLIESLENRGYQVTGIVKTKVRSASKDGFQKHMVRMSHKDLNLLTNVGDSRPEIVLVNSHDGLSSLKIMLGIYRLVCSNGMIVGSTFGQETVRHMGDVMSQVETGLLNIANKIPEISDKINQFSGLELDVSKQNDFANLATKLVLPNGANVVNFNRVLSTRRQGDQGQSLWLVYNRLQESLLRLGVQYTMPVFNADSKLIGMKHNTTRAIKSIDRQVEVNRALWDIANQFAA